ncbi:MAG: hypothetical protein QF553_06375 [Alphaproteobacteria bacterium]|jgi:hypothetical protein|nr:hypothetical protein [Alphaproteobacteria bacterium]
MILGVDHLALSTDNFEDACHVLESSTYAPVFTVEDGSTSQEISPFMHQFSPDFHMAYCRSPAGGVTLELTRYSPPRKANNPGYGVLFSAAPEGIRKALPPKNEGIWTPVLRAAMDVDVHPAFWEPFSASVWVGDGTAASTHILGILSPTSNIENATRFWREGLHFSLKGQGVTDEGRKWARLVLPSPVPAWRLDLVLAEDEEIYEEAMLDQAGFPCLGLLSSNVEEDANRAHNAGGHDFTQLFTMRINQKAMKLIMFRTPEGKLVELIELDKQGDMA